MCKHKKHEGNVRLKRRTSRLDRFDHKTLSKDHASVHWAGKKASVLNFHARLHTPCYNSGTRFSIIFQTLKAYACVALYKERMK